MLESELHHRIRLAAAEASNAAAAAGVVVVGPGDDCAVVATPAASQLLTVDHLIEGRHFVGPFAPQAGAAAGTPLELIARKAIARSVSDIAAMAGRPAWALATAAFPAGTPQAAADELCDWLFRWATTFGCPLVGGDVAAFSASQTPLVLTVTVGGTPHEGRGPVLRSTAKPGDAVYITGPMGNSLASGRHLTFTPRTREAAVLASVLGTGLHAMMDLSDGLGRDGARIARASNVRLILDPSSFPINADVPQVRGHDAAAGGFGGHPHSRALAAASDGEDYELLLTAPPLSTAETAALIAAGVVLHRIGEVESAGPGTPAGCFVVTTGSSDSPERLVSFDSCGFEHA